MVAVVRNGLAAAQSPFQSHPIHRTPPGLDPTALGPDGGNRPERMDHTAETRDADSSGSEPPDAEPVLRTEDLDVERGGRLVLAGVTLSVPADARLLIRGPSGAGKTTLFRVLGLLEPPTSGEVYVEGRPTRSLREGERAAVRRETVGIVFQDFQLVPDLTARENAALPQEHVRGNRDPDWLDELFDRLDITDLSDQYPATLSGGEKQRVLLARALAQDAPCLLLDEPTASLDINHQVRTLGLVADLDETVVAAIHNLNLAARFCDRIALLADGKLRAVGPPEDVLTAERLEQAFGTPVTVGEHPVTGTPVVTAFRQRGQEI